MTRTKTRMLRVHEDLYQEIGKLASEEMISKVYASRELANEFKNMKHKWYNKRI